MKPLGENITSLEFLNEITKSEKALVLVCYSAHSP